MKFQYQEIIEKHLKAPLVIQYYPIKVNQFKIVPTTMNMENLTYIV